MAIFGMGVMVGPTLGPTLGGWITDNYSWPWIFYVNIPLGIMAGLMTWRYVPEPEHAVKESSSIDWVGLGLLIVGIGSLQVLLERGEARDWFESKEIITEAILAATGLILFIWYELRAAHPIVNLRVLRDRQLAAGVTFGMLLGFAVYASVFALPVFLQSLLGYSAWDTGRVILPGAIASAVAMAMMAKLTAKVDSRILITFGVLLFGLSMWMHAHLTTEIGTQDLFWPMILRGTGLGFVFVPLTGVAIANLAPQDVAQGTGLYNLSRQLGGSFGIAITATLITRFREQGREALLPHLATTEPAVRRFMDATVQRMMQLGGTLAEAQQKAARVLELKLDAQAAMLAYEKIFLIMGVAFLCALPLLLLIKTGKAKSGGVAH